MKVEIESYYLKDGILEIEGIDLDSYERNVIDRGREDHPQDYQVKFVFDTKLASHFSYVRDFLKRQKAVHKANPATYGKALHAILGTVVDLNRKFAIKSYAC